MATTTYRTGTITLTDGSATVTGTGTAWESADLEPNMMLSAVVIPAIDVSMSIQTVVSDTELTLTAPWTGGDLTDVTYEINRDMTSLGLPIVQRGDMAPYGVIAEAFRRVNNLLANWVASWGSIAGTITDQTDLSDALNASAETAVWGSVAGDIADQTDLADVAKTNDYGDLDNRPTLGSAAAADTTDFAPAAAGLPSGGTEGQVLTRGDGSPDYEWTNLPTPPLTIRPLTAADDTGLIWHEWTQQAIGATAYETLFDLSGGGHELLSCIVYGHRCGVRLTIDGTVVFNRTTDAIGEAVPNTGANNMFTVFEVPPAVSTTSMKLEVYNAAGVSRNYGARALLRAIP